MGKIKILVVEDEAVLRELLCDILQQQGYETLEAGDGERALDIFFETEDIGLVILDILMPKLNGWQVLRHIREYSDIPVIMLTALGDEKNEVAGLETGANDYIGKPFSYEVFVARVKAQLRKSSIMQEELLQVGDIQINQQKCKAYVKNRSLELNNKEYQLLAYLLKNAGIVLNREQILTSVWGFDYDGSERTVDTHIKMVRAKLEECGYYIKTIRGQGYCFEAGEEDEVN